MGLNEKEHSSFRDLLRTVVQRLLLCDSSLLINSVKVKGHVTCKTQTVDSCHRYNLGWLHTVQVTKFQFFPLRWHTFELQRESVSGKKST